MEARSIYRQLHQIPELSGQEVLTAQQIESALRAMGYTPHRIGDTGVYADRIADPSLPWLLFRADMDALPVQEDSCAPCSSTHPGVMHACGHDAHCAMLLEAAAQLRTMTLPHNIRFLFQPAEETTKGASQLIAAGAIPPNACACFAMHVWPGIQKGVVATRPGALMASSDVYRIEIVGKSAHCAQRSKGADALQTAVQIAARLPSIEQLAQGDGTILFCGSIHSGSAHNVVPDSAELFGTLRTYREEIRQTIKSALEQTTQELCAQFGTTARVLWDGGCPAIRNSAALIERLRQIEPTLQTDTAPTMAAEDFACYQEHIPGLMLWLGIGDVPPLHNPTFYVPEEMLPRGVSLWLNIARYDWKGD